MSTRSFETFPGKNFPCGILPKKVNVVEKKCYGKKAMHTCTLSKLELMR